MSSTVDNTVAQTRTMTLRHYGATRYDRKKFLPISDEGGGYLKPRGGLWTSPVDASFGWREWCQCEEFQTDRLSRHFDVQFTGRVIRIHTVRDLEKLPWVLPLPHCPSPLFQPLVLMGVDAIYLTEQGQQQTRFSQPYHLYGWDCECVLVLNPETLQPL